MRYLFALVLGIGVGVSSTAASAQEAMPPPLELGLSSGYSKGLEPLSAIPLLLDVDYRLSPRWGAGVYGEVGFPFVSTDDSESDYAAGGHHYRFGIEAQYHVKSETRFSAWCGFGVGYDVLRANYHVTSSYWDSLDPSHPSFPLHASGFELGHLRGGIDVRVVPAFSIGPFVSASVVAYRNQVGVASSDVNLWLNLGMKATLRL